MQLDEVMPLLEDSEAAAKSGSWVAVALSFDSAPAFDPALEARRSANTPLAWMAVFDAPSSQPAIEDRAFSLSEWHPVIRIGEYREKIAEIKRCIECGDTYQVNYTFALRAALSGDSWGCFNTLAAVQRASYSAYIDIGTHRILSFSPELFFTRRGSRIVTCPMKGTAPRGRWVEEDDSMAAQLRESVKDRAENAMIVDLLRNDLGRIAETGSVEVSDMFAVERLPTVLQMTSTVAATARPEIRLTDIITALFPCGSVTGAPKIKTTSIIKELESSPRGFYTGALGFISPDGDATFNVAIRTIVIDAKSQGATFGVGGGITWDSTADREYEECRLKAKFLTEERKPFALLETLALVDGSYRLLERHFARARNSAKYFGFAWSEDLARAELDAVRTAHLAGTWRVRLLIDADQVSTEVEPLIIVHKPAPLSVTFAAVAVDDNDPMLQHKTTDRSRYQTQLKLCAEYDDVIFWNSRREVTESSVANIVLAIDGTNWTPPREAGLLCGTFRDELISTGKIVERTILIDELERAENFHLVNSVRGWMKAKLSSRPPGSRSLKSSE